MASSRSRNSSAAATPAGSNWWITYTLFITLDGGFDALDVDRQLCIPPHLYPPELIAVSVLIATCWWFVFSVRRRRRCVSNPFRFRHYKQTFSRCSHSRPEPSSRRNDWLIR